MATRISDAALIVCCLFVAGQLAAASKTFGVGYGEAEAAVSAGGTVTPTTPEPATPAAAAAVSTTPNKDEPYGVTVITPTVSEPAAEAAVETALKKAVEAAVSTALKKDESYGVTVTPTTPAVSTAPKKDEAYGGTVTTPTTPEPATPAAAATETQPPNTPAEATGGQEAGGGYAAVGSSDGGQQQQSSEPLNGLNEKVIDAIVKEHNLFRAEAQVPPLTWNATLAKFAQEYAETLKKDCKMVHSSSPYGENLMFGSGPVSWKGAVDMWSDEKKNYNYAANSCEPGKMCGHYTAIVWKDTTSVGCGRVLCDNKDTMIVCSYWPPGNYEGKRPY